MYFNFVGNLVLNGLETEHPFLREGVTAKKAAYKSVSMIVQAAKNNSAFTEIFGMERDTIKTKNKDGQDIEIAWADRLDADVIASVDGRRKFTFVNGEDRHEFLTEWDLINYIAENYDEINGQRAMVTGQVGKNEYNGKVSNRFVFKAIYLLDEESNAKNGLRIKAPMYFAKNGIDTADWNDEKKLTITGYTREYAGKDDDGNSSYKYYELTTVLDASKADFENEKHLKMINFRLKQLGCELTTGNKVKVTAKKGYYANQFEILLYQGAEEVEFTYDELTDTQKEMVDLGMKTVEDFKPRGQAYGDRVVVYKITGVDATGDFKDGIIKADEDTDAEIEENIYVPVAAEKKVEESDALNETTDKADSKAEAAEEDEEDLFS